MEMTKEIMHEQFKKLKSNPEKVKYLIDLKETKQKKSNFFRFKPQNLRFKSNFRYKTVRK